MSKSFGEKAQGGSVSVLDILAAAKEKIIYFDQVLSEKASFACLGAGAHQIDKGAYDINVQCFKQSAKLSNKKLQEKASYPLIKGAIEALLEDLRDIGFSKINKDFLSVTKALERLSFYDALLSYYEILNDMSAQETAQQNNRGATIRVFNTAGEVLEWTKEEIDDFAQYVECDLQGYSCYKDHKADVIRVFSGNGLTYTNHIKGDSLECLSALEELCKKMYECDPPQETKGRGSTALDKVRSILHFEGV